MHKENNYTEASKIIKADIVKQHEDIEQLKAIVEGCKIFFDNYTVNDIKLFRNAGKKNYNKWSKAMDMMYGRV